MKKHLIELFSFVVKKVNILTLNYYHFHRICGLNNDDAAISVSLNQREIKITRSNGRTS